jgi:hypothetical protein
MERAAHVLAGNVSKAEAAAGRSWGPGRTFRTGRSLRSRWAGLVVVSARPLSDCTRFGLCSAPGMELRTDPTLRQRTQICNPTFCSLLASKCRHLAHQSKFGTAGAITHLH